MMPEDNIPKWIGQTIDPDKYAKIVSAVKSHFSSGHDSIDLNELVTVAEAIGGTKEDATYALALMSSDPSPLLKGGFYRLSEGHRVAIPADERRALLSLRTTNPAQWKLSAKQMFIAYRLA